MKKFIQILAFSAIAVCGWANQVYADTVPAPAQQAVPQTHAHNDYEHDYPLFDALHNGFVSVESDIWLYGSDLRVAHDPVNEPTELPTLEQLYLSPLQNLAKQANNGGIYGDGTPVTLLVDIKSEAIPTYQRLNDVLGDYATQSPKLFTTYTKNASGGYDMKQGAVNVIISGNRPREYMQSQDIRYASYDGRKSDISTGANAKFVSLISDNWSNVFTGDLAWDGTGSIPDDTKVALENIVAQVHDEDKILRFWNLPQDAPSVWGPLYDAGVDLINTNDIDGLSQYIEHRKSEAVPEPSPTVALLGVLGVSAVLTWRKHFQSRTASTANSKAD